MWENIGSGIGRGRVLGWMGCRRVLWRDRVWGGKGWREGAGVDGV